MENFKIFLILLVIVISIFETVNSACSITARTQIPLFIKNFGTKKIILPKEISQIKLESGEAIQAHCSNGIVLSTDYQNYIQSEQGVNSIEFYCNASSLSFVRLGGGYTAKYLERYTAYVSCSNSLQSLYESREILPNCEKYSSYAIGIAPTEHPQIVSAGICYDLDKLSIKYVNYLAYRSEYSFLEPENNSNSTLEVGLDIKLNGFNSLFYFLSPENFNTQFDSKKKMNPLLKMQTFDFDHIIQDAILKSELLSYQNMFKIIWWHNLRVGNWLFFQKALKKQSEQTTFTIYTGTSGVLTIPNEECERHEMFTIENKEMMIKAPAYIWSYIKSSKDEFVIIGFNSPFLQIQNTTLSCKDMCNEIDWLAKSLFIRTHLMPNLGLVHCCHVEDIADKMDNFPLSFVKPKPETNSTTKAPATTKKPKAKVTDKPKDTEEVFIDSEDNDD